MNTLILIVACVLIIIYLITEGKSDGFLNESSMYKNIKQRGAEKFFSIATALLSIAFMVLSLLEVM